MKLLTRRTMAILRIQRLLPAQLVPDLTAMTACFIASVKIWVIIVDLVGCSMLPFIVLAFSVSIIAIVAIGTVCRCVLGHGSRSGVELGSFDAGEGSGCWSNGA